MELMQVKNTLHGTVVGALLSDGMGCSEPVLLLKDGKLIDNFFVYMANRKACLVSGPVGIIGLQAETENVEYLRNCEKIPFSLGPKETMRVTYPDFQPEDYRRYCTLYGQMRNIAYKSNCTESEKQIIADYVAAFKKIVAPEMIRIYEEVTPSFFVWVRNITG